MKLFNNCIYAGHNKIQTVCTVIAILLPHNSDNIDRKGCKLRQVIV